MNLKNIIRKYEYYLILSYILTLIGAIIPYYLPLYKFHFQLYVLLMLLTFSSAILDYLAFKIFKIDHKTGKEYIEINYPKFNIYFFKQIKQGSIDSYIQFKRIIGIIGLILIPILNINYNFNINTNDNYHYIHLITFSFIMTQNFTFLIRRRIFEKDTSHIQTPIFLGILVLMIIISNPTGLYLLNKILSYILNNLQNAFTVLIAIIMLCVGLSALSFEYCSILKEDDETRKKMKKNGEGYFIASITSMISIIFLFITSILKTHVKLITINQLNIFTYDFLLLNIYAICLIIIFSFTSYAIYYLIKCSLLSLKELNFLENQN